MSNPSMNGGPCLQYLDLSKNNLIKIESFFFRAFNCGSIKSLVLQSSDLHSIDEGKLSNAFFGFPFSISILMLFATFKTKDVSGNLDYECQA